MAVVERALRTALEVVLDRRAVVGDHRVDAKAERAGLRQLLEHVEDVARLAGVVQADEAATFDFGDRGERGGSSSRRATAAE